MVTLEKYNCVGVIWETQKKVPLFSCVKIACLFLFGGYHLRSQLEMEAP